jgi:hypothetical protein
MYTYIHKSLIIVYKPTLSSQNIPSQVSIHAELKIAQSHILHRHTILPM